MSANPVARPSSRRSLLVAGISGIAAGAVALGAHAALADPDPVFALIAKEKAAWDAFDRVIRDTDFAVLGRENTPEEEAEWRAASAAQMVALLAVMRAQPVTGAGLIAAIDLFSEREMMNVGSPLDELLIELFDSVRAFIRKAS